MLVVITQLILLIACAGPQKIQEAAPVEEVKPIVKAREAIKEGDKAIEENDIVAGIQSFEDALRFFEEALPTSTEADSVAYNIEVVTLNIAKFQSDVAVKAYERKDFPTAKTYYEKSLASYKAVTPTTITSDEHKELLANLYRYMAYTQQELRSYEAALVSLDEVLKLDPKDEAALNLKFNILRNDIKDEVRAFKVLKDFAEVSNDVNAYITLANNYRDNGNNKEAEVNYLKALELKPEVSVMMLIADFYRNNGEWAKSTAMYERVLSAKPDNETTAATYRRIGENYSQAGNNPKMLEFFEKYLAIEKDRQIALLVASRYNEAKNYAKVAQYTSLVISLDNRNADAYMLRGLAYYNLKRNNEAKADFQKIENDPKHGANAKKFLNVLK